MKKIIIPILLITLFGCKSSVEFDKFKTIITPNLINESLITASKEPIKLEFDKKQNGVEFYLDASSLYESDNEKDSYVKIIVKKGKTILSDKRYEKHKKDIAEYKLDKIKVPGVSSGLINIAVLSFTQNIGQRAIQPPNEDNTIIFTTSDGNYDIKIMYHRTKIKSLFRGIFEDKLHVSTLAEHISEKYNKKYLTSKDSQDSLQSP